MSQPFFLSSVSRQIPETADAWFARLHSPDCSEQDRAAFGEWLNADPDRSKTYADCERLWNARQQLAANSDLVQAAFTEAGLSSTQRRAPRKQVRWAATIALAAGLATLAWMILNPGHTTLEPGAIATAHGEQRHINLPDGSKIQLNTDTLVVARVDQAQRRVVLKRGEAFFDVARDPQRPFIVEVGTSEVRVVGTKFNVRENAGKLEVVVSEGTVNVVPEAKKSVGEKAERVELTRGSRLHYDTEQKLVKVATVDPDRSLVWRTGMIEFDHTSLEDAVAEVNRYASKPLAIDDERLRSIQLSGGFRAGDVDAVLFALKERFDIAATERDNRILLTLTSKQ